MVDKEEYENGSAKMQIYHQGDGENLVFIQSGLVGMYMKTLDILDLYELLEAYIEDLEND